MRKEEYTPQFDFNNIDSTKPSYNSSISKCVRCGKESVSLFKGECFSCRQKDKVNDNSDTKQKKSSKRFILSLIIPAVLIFVIIHVLAFFCMSVAPDGVFTYALYSGLVGMYSVYLISVPFIIIKLIARPSKKTLIKTKTENDYVEDENNYNLFRL